MLEFQPLESRTLMAATVAFDALTGVLSLTGSEASDRIQVNLAAGGSDLSIAIDGKITLHPVAGVTQIHLIGGGASDLLSIGATVRIPGLFDGGAGKDLMSGGGAVDVFLAFGDGAGDLIAGGGGTDTAYVDRNDSANVERKIFGPAPSGGGTPTTTATSMLTDDAPSPKKKR
jgi:hypothetical protein